MTQQNQTTSQQLRKEATPPREKLPKNYKLPNDWKGSWFMSMSKAEQRSFMIADNAGLTRAKNASKRDIEQYAESSANRNVGRASVAV
jgi:hypothetical protein